MPSFVLNATTTLPSKPHYLPGSSPLCASRWFSLPRLPGCGVQGHHSLILIHLTHGSEGSWAILSFQTEPGRSLTPMPPLRVLLPRLHFPWELTVTASRHGASSAVGRQEPHGITFFTSGWRSENPGDFPFRSTHRRLVTCQAPPIPHPPLHTKRSPGSLEPLTSLDHTDT